MCWENCPFEQRCERGVHAIRSAMVKMREVSTYTTVDSLKRVVVWSVVVSTSVANCVAVGVGTQSPIFASSARLLVCLAQSRASRNASGLVQEHTVVTRRISFSPAVRSQRRNSGAVASQSPSGPMSVTTRMTHRYQSCTSHEYSFSAGRLGPPRTHTGQQPRSEQT